MLWRALRERALESATAQLLLRALPGSPGGGRRCVAAQPGCGSGFLPEQSCDSPAPGSHRLHNADEDEASRCPCARSHLVCLVLYRCVQLSPLSPVFVPLLLRAAHNPPSGSVAESPPRQGAPCSRPVGGQRPQAAEDLRPLRQLASPPRHVVPCSRPVGNQRPRAAEDLRPLRQFASLEEVRHP